MTLTSPHIRIFLTLALFFAVAPLCATTVTCEPCQERASFADANKTVGELAKRPLVADGSAPRIALPAPIPALYGVSRSGAGIRFIPPAPVVPLRI